MEQPTEQGFYWAIIFNTGIPEPVFFEVNGDLKRTHAIGVHNDIPPA